MSFAWSHSVVDMFDTCPKKYYHIKIAKDAKDEDSSFSAEGKEIHTAMYKRVIFKEPLPIAMRQYEATARRYDDLPGERQGELKFALDDKLNPVGFFAKTAWVRSVVDFMVVNYERKHVIIVDWKTGKPKDGFDQLKLSAAVVSRYLPEINKFTLVYEWLNHAVKPSAIAMEKQHMRAVWTDSYEKVKEIQTAVKLTNFPAREGPLCKWCPVRQCPHNKKTAK